MQIPPGEELAFASATELAGRIRAREVSPRELVSLFLQRIERINPRIGAYVTLTGERAMAEAEAAERMLRVEESAQVGPLFGLPISIKDLSPTKGVRTTFGSPAFEHFVPEMDNPDVARLFQAGAIMLGKTNTPELGLSMSTEDGLFPPTHNPWDLSRSPGGSSGGAGAALAARLCSLATGSDAGGSIRIPAAACGVVGLKPSRGRVIPRPFDSAAIAGFASPGPMAHTVADVKLLLSVLTPPFMPIPPMREDPTAGLRVGWTTKSAVTQVDPEVAMATERVAQVLADLGHNVAEAAPDVSGVYDAFLTIIQAHTAVTPIPEPDKLGTHARAMIESGKRHSAIDYLQAEFTILDLSRRVMEWFRRFDILVCPTLPVTAPQLGSMGGTEEEIRQTLDRFGAFTYWVNTTGQPAISLPLGQSADGLPIGVQLVGRVGSDDLLLSVAEQLEVAMPWVDRIPAIAFN
ncbi:MAG: amidase [Nitrolancea sp.]